MKLACVAVVLAFALTGCGAPDAAEEDSPVSDEWTPAELEACTQTPGEADWDALTRCRELVLND